MMKRFHIEELAKDIKDRFQEGKTANSVSKDACV